MDHAFFFHFCILQVIKNWMVGRSGNEVSLFSLTATRVTTLWLKQPQFVYAVIYIGTTDTKITDSRSVAATNTQGSLTNNIGGWTYNKLKINVRPAI